MKARFALICFFLVCILWFADGRCDVADFRVNDDFGTAYQGYSHIAVDLDGNFVVSWYDKRNGDNDIYLQAFDHLGNRSGSNRRVNDDPVGNEQLRPSLMKDQLGKFIIVWQDFRVTGYPFNGDIYGQRFNADGSLVSTNAKINDDFGVETQGWQDIDCDDFGNYVVVWEDNRNGNYDIYAQRYHKSGTKLGANIRVNDDAGAAYQHNPKVTVDGDGDFIVTWYDNRSGRDNIMAQRFNVSGVAQGTNFLVNDNITNNKCVFADVACDYNGNFTIAWIDYRNGVYPNNPDVYARNYWANGTARSDNYRVNVDGGAVNQAEVSVAMDYFGNFIIAWRDDRLGNNDIYAQYYRAEGSSLGGNYRVNSDAGTATQSFPNVTMDGINIYYTWTDDRNGSFDIYAKITEYGAPAIVVTPTSLTFSAQQGGSNPPSQQLLVNNQGYGILNYSVTDNQPWLTVTPTTGAAPATLAVSVSIAGLAYGDHSGRITISDASGKDSSRTVVVALSITAPVLSITPSSIDVQTQFGSAPPDDRYVMIENSGTGTLDWSASGAPNWLRLSQVSGTAPSAVDLIFETDSLPGPGEYSAAITVTSPQAANSPQQFTVNLSYIVNTPILTIDPDTLHFSFLAGASVPAQELVIYNSGTGTIDWMIVPDATWVATTPEAMLGDGVVSVSINTALLQVGEHHANLTISDAAAVNSPLNAVVHATVLRPPDTLALEAISAAVGQPFEVALSLRNYLAVDSVAFDLTFDDDAMTLDSVSTTLRSGGVLTWQSGVPTVLGITSVAVASSPMSDPLAEGSGAIAILHFTAGSDVVDGEYPIDLSGSVRDTTGAISMPIALAGSAAITSSTPVYPVESPIMPTDFTLGPNYPNPFNAATIIPYTLSQSSSVDLRVLNILGQHVKTIFTGEQRIGGYYATWDGDADTGEMLPTGIYFVRLQADDQSRTIKVLLLK